MNKTWQTYRHTDRQTDRQTDTIQLTGIEKYLIGMPLLDFSNTEHNSLNVRLRYIVILTSNGLLNTWFEHMLNVGSLPVKIALSFPELFTKI